MENITKEQWEAAYAKTVVTFFADNNVSDEIKGKVLANVKMHTGKGGTTPVEFKSAEE